MTSGPRMTLQTQLVLRVALTEPTSEWYGLQMVRATALPSGTVYPIIARLERCDWITSRWEDPKEHVTEGRPRRRYYRLTDKGAEAARLALANAYQGRAADGLPWGNLSPGFQE
jgi:PadR family transcriptional regulator PadR